MTSAYPYISPVEFASYGIGDASPAQVDTAARLVNNYLNRPEGLIWVAGADGFPCYMAWKEPTLTLTLLAAISPGQNVVVNIPGAQFGLQNIGEVVVLDRLGAGSLLLEDGGNLETEGGENIELEGGGNPAVTEACVISAVSPSSITLQNVQFAHATGAALDFGMSIVDEVAVAPKRTTVMTSRTPVARLQSGYGRYGFGRRSTQYSGADVASNLLAYVAAFGGPPLWTQFDVTDVDMNPMTGTLWCPPGILLAYFSDVRLHYCAGWQANNVPGNVKQAVANLVRAAIDLPYGASAKLVKAGNATIERFGNTLIDDDTKQLLEPYRAKFVA